MARVSRPLSAAVVDGRIQQQQPLSPNRKRPSTAQRAQNKVCFIIFSSPLFTASIEIQKRKGFLLAKDVFFYFWCCCWFPFDCPPHRGQWKREDVSWNQRRDVSPGFFHWFCQWEKPYCAACLIYCLSASPRAEIIFIYTVYYPLSMQRALSLLDDVARIRPQKKNPTTDPT